MKRNRKSVSQVEREWKAQCLALQKVIIALVVRSGGSVYLPMDEIESHDMTKAVVEKDEAGLKFTFDAPKIIRLMN